MKFTMYILAMLLSPIFLFAQAPDNWFHMDASEGYNGVSSDKAYSELLSGKSSKTVVVAIIDSGMDADHEDLADNMWVNQDEIPGNNIDDDNNGYVDDIHGWNFIGGPKGNVNEDTYEVTRLYAKYKYKYENADRSQLSSSDKVEYDNFKIYEAAVNEELTTAKDRLERYSTQKSQLIGGIDALEVAMGDKAITLENLGTIESSSDEVTMGMNIAANVLAEEGEIKSYDALRDMIDAELAGAVDYFQGKLDYAYNIDFNPRTIVGDDYSNSNQRYYGNNDVEGPDALHGTHVGGIVGAVRNNGIGMNGVADNVRLMSIRTVPNGDERDKDVANAIRYAVDNGASIVNMSFGKGYSWDKKVVDEAMRYAAKNDVLLVHAAGNAAQNNDTSDNFPTDTPEKKKLFGPKIYKNWIEVGALNFEQGQDLSATFSNYGKSQVDIFAPGVSIYATTPGDEYQHLQGTSMAAPVVAGVAAMVRSYYPSLSAAQVKDVLLSSSVKMNEEVLIPGQDGKTAPFSSLSVTGGVVNAFNAIKAAGAIKGKRKKKFLSASNYIPKA